MYVQELPWQVNYNESEVPLYTLPDVLTAVDGSKITTAAEWEANRDALVQVFRDVMYGRRPPMADKVEYTLLGEIVVQQLLLLEKRYPCLVVDQYVIMPNHIHVIFFLTD